MKLDCDPLCPGSSARRVEDTPASCACGQHPATRGALRISMNSYGQACEIATRLAQDLPSGQLPLREQLVRKQEVRNLFGVFQVSLPISAFALQEQIERPNNPTCVA